MLITSLFGFGVAKLLGPVTAPNPEMTQNVAIYGGRHAKLLKSWNGAGWAIDFPWDLDDLLARRQAAFLAFLYSHDRVLERRQGAKRLPLAQGVSHAAYVLQTTRDSGTAFGTIMG